MGPPHCLIVSLNRYKFVIIVQGHFITVAEHPHLRVVRGAVPEIRDIDHRSCLYTVLTHIDLGIPLAAEEISRMLLDPAQVYNSAVGQHPGIESCIVRIIPEHGSPDIILGIHQRNALLDIITLDQHAFISALFTVRVLLLTGNTGA